MQVRNQVRDHEADIVPVHRILLPRIAKARPDLHGFLPESKTSVHPE
jgi:hypothetical protein